MSRWFEVKVTTASVVAVHADDDTSELELFNMVRSEFGVEGHVEVKIAEVTDPAEVSILLRHADYCIE